MATSSAASRRGSVAPGGLDGSHLDSVPQGGRYDGALGVVAGIEVLERLGPRRRTLAVVSLREEERGCVGSQRICAGGALPGAYVELHHEQRPRLATAP